MIITILFETFLLNELEPNTLLLIHQDLVCHIVDNLVITEKIKKGLEKLIKSTSISNDIKDTN